MKLYLDWLANDAAKHITGRKFIFLDNHGSHRTKEVLQFARVNEMTLINLYPNTTRTTQPLDANVFLPIKTVYRSKIAKWSMEHPGQAFDVSDLAPLIDSACQQLNTEQLIKKAFRETGIYPWNANNMHFEQCLGKIRAATTDVYNSPPKSTTNDQLRIQMKFHLDEAARIEKLLEGDESEDFVPTLTSSPATPTNPSTSRLAEMLSLPGRSERLGKRKTTRFSFVTTSNSYLELEESQDREREEVEQKKEERRQKIARNKAAAAEKKELVAGKKAEAAEKKKQRAEATKENPKKRKGNKEASPPIISPPRPSLLDIFNTNPSNFQGGMFSPQASPWNFEQPKLIQF